MIAFFSGFFKLYPLLELHGPNCSTAGDNTAYCLSFRWYLRLSQCLGPQIFSCMMYRLFRPLDIINLNMIHKLGTHVSIYSLAN